MGASTTSGYLSRPRPTLKDSVRIAASAIEPGMFVVALDRPWEGTPFLIQGFLVEDVDQISLLRSLCAEVVIDPRRSAADSLRELINLYDLPEESQGAADGEPTVRLRFVDYARSSGPIPTRAPWLGVGRLMETVSKGFPIFRGGAKVDVGWRRQSPGLAAGADDLQVSRPAMPIFSRSQIQYVSAPAPSGDGYLSARNSAVVDWGKTRNRLSRRDAETDDPAVLVRLAQFEDFVRSMQSDVSGWISNVGGLIKGGTPRRPARRPSLGWRRRSNPPEWKIPKYIEILIYRDKVDIAAEVARARGAMTSAEDILAQLRADTSIEGGLRVDGLPAVVDSLVASISRNPHAMIWVSRVRVSDSTAYNHSIKVASYLMAFGRHLGFPAAQLGQLAQIGLLMDIGKLDLPADLVNKREPLTEAEFKALKEHVNLGLSRLSASMELEPAIREGIAQHHEWIDGSGYPEGLAGDQIGIFGRMAAIADTYAALTTHRPYAPTLSSYDALQLMYAHADQQLHGPLVEQFVRAIGLYPVGSLVLLSTEEVAVVTALDKAQRLEPRVLVLTEPNKSTLDRPYEMDLVRKPKDGNGEPIRILRSLPSGVHNIDFRNFYIA